MAFAWVEQQKSQALSLKLDFEKAFDQVDFNYIWATLEAMGLGRQFPTLIEDLLMGRSIKININGHFYVDTTLH